MIDISYSMYQTHCLWKNEKDTLSNSELNKMHNLFHFIDMEKHIFFCDYFYSRRIHISALYV